jgi:hypothetical protein
MITAGSSTVSMTLVPWRHPRRGCPGVVVISYRAFGAAVTAYAPTFSRPSYVVCTIRRLSWAHGMMMGRMSEGIRAHDGAARTPLLGRAVAHALMQSTKIVATHPYLWFARLTLDPALMSAWMASTLPHKHAIWMPA